MTLRLVWHIACLAAVQHRRREHSAGGRRCLPSPGEYWESDMISEIQVHTIARQMLEKHGFEAIAQAAQKALACESKGETEEAEEWRHIENAMKLMRGPHQS
jgi:hypothetical protein